MHPLLQWKRIFSVCVCSLGYPACNTHVPYCHLWPIQLYCIFPHYLINSKIFSKTLLKIKCIFLFSLQHLSKKFLVLTMIHQDIIIHRSLCKIPVLLSDFNETWIFWRGFEKYLNIKFHKNLSSWSQLCPSIGPKERRWQALDRLLLVSNFLTFFWMQHLDGARLSPNSVRNAVWHALNERACQYLTCAVRLYT